MEREEQKHLLGDTVHINMTGIICQVERDLFDRITYKLMDTTGKYIAYGIPQQYLTEEEGLASQKGV